MRAWIVLAAFAAAIGCGIKGAPRAPKPDPTPAPASESPQSPEAPPRQQPGQPPFQPSDADAGTR